MSTARTLGPVAATEAAMNDAERSEVRSQLQADIRRLRCTVADAVAEQARRAREHDDRGMRGDESDISAYRSGIGQDVSLAEHAATLLASNEYALARLADGNYEQCESCGQQIGTERLRALPRATLCMGCRRSCDPPAKPTRVTPRAARVQALRIV
jgi:DnaK suppressor protein